MISLSFVFVGIGMFFSAPLGLLILEEYGLSATFLILASIYLQTCVLAVLCKPSVLEKNFHRQRNNSEMHKRKSSYFNFYLLYNKPFLCFLISTSTWNFALTTGIMHLPNYLRVNGESDAEIGYYMTSFSVANTAGRMCGAFFSSRDNFNHLAAHFTSVGLAGVITLLFPLYSNGGVGKYSFSILLGLLCGCPNALMTVLAINFVGVSMLPEVNALSYVFSGIGVTTGPIVSGIYFKNTFHLSCSQCNIMHKKSISYQKRCRMPSSKAIARYLSKQFSILNNMYVSSRGKYSFNKAMLNQTALYSRMSPCK